MMKKNFTYNVNSYHPMPQIMFIPAKHTNDSCCKTKLITSENACFNAVGVALLIAQGCQTIVQATLGWRMLCVEQHHRCYAF